MGKYKAVLFDFDGVIGKTMEDNYIAWKYALGKYNVKFNKEEYFLNEGCSPYKVAEYFLPIDLKNDLTIKQLASIKDEYYNKNNNFSLYKNVPDVLNVLKNEGYFTALVTGGSKKRIFNTLNGTIIKMFDAIVTADSVEKGKPFPDPFLKAASILSISPDQCVVIENAPMGIQSAKSAGMFCIAITSTLDKKFLEQSDLIVNDINEIIEFL